MLANSCQDQTAAGGLLPVRQDSSNYGHQPPTADNDVIDFDRSPTVCVWSDTSRDHGNETNIGAKYRLCVRLRAYF